MAANTGTTGTGDSTDTLVMAVTGPRTAVTGPSNAASQTPEDMRKVSLVYDLFYRARNARRPLLSQWRKNHKTLNNRQQGPRPEAWVPSPEVPEIWPIVASLVSWMTDQYPTVDVTASAAPFSTYADFYNQLADDMNTVMSANFMQYNLSGQISQVLWDVCTYGIGYLKNTWKPWLFNGKGDAVFDRVDPFTLYPDPYARNDDQLTFIIEARSLPLFDVDRAYPGALAKISTANTVEADTAPHKLDGQISDTSPRVNLAAMAPSTSPRYGSQTPSQRGIAGTTDAPIVTLLECWVRTHEHDKQKDGTTRTREHWRCIVVCGNVLLLDEDASDLNAHGGHPYSRMVLFDTGEWYGPCLVEFMTAPQESINRILAMIEANIALIGNPMLVESPRSQSNNKRITNRPGQRINANPQDIQWMSPPAMAPDLATNLLTYYAGKLESISGMSAIVRGFTPNGRNSQGVMDSVQDSAFVRVRGTLRELERCLATTGRKQLADIAEFYTEPRMLAIIGPDGNRTTKVLRSRHFYELGSDDPEDQQPLAMNLTVDAGSQMPTSKQARTAMALQLFTLGAIDEPELLKAIDWPNYNVVASRVQQAKAEAGTLGTPPGARQRAGH